MAYQFERLDENNLHHLVLLYKKVFNKSVDVDYVRQKYATDYTGKSFLGFIAFDEKGDPVAFNGAVPFKISYKDKIYTGAQFGDAMTLKEHAGKGLFTKCGERSNTLIKNEGIPIIYGFPNQNSHYGYFNNLNWTKLHQMHRYEIKLEAWPVSKALRKIGINPYQKSSENIFIDEILQNSCLEGNSAGTYRDRDFFNYKAFLKNGVTEVADKKVWLKIQENLLIGDVEVTDKHQFYKIIDELKKIGRKYGCSSIIFQSSPDTYLDNMLKEKLKPKYSWTAGFLDLGAGFDLHKLRFNYGDLDTF